MKNPHIQRMDYHTETTNDEYARQRESAFFRSGETPHFSAREYPTLTRNTMLWQIGNRQSAIEKF